MQGILVKPIIVKGIKDMISYFWQPSMQSRNNYNINLGTGYKKPRRQIDIKDHLSLDSIMVLRIVKSYSYMVTMMGLRQNNCDDRILLSSGKREMDVIAKCLEDNLEIERKSIINYMPSDYIDIYNEALSRGNYECCLTMLKGIESHMNEVSKEIKRVLKKDEE